jgi:N-acetylglucosaminyldiphosphoundecaprenol N-acetyl-beta-D-mannosaminyltransferase
MGATNSRPKRSVCGVLIDPIEISETVDLIVERARTTEPMAVSALAVHGVMMGVQDLGLRGRLNRMDLVVPDGQPVRWAVNMMYRAQLQECVTGPSLMLEVCSAAAREDMGVYLYGSTPKVIEALSKRLPEAYPGLRVVGSAPSRFGPLDERGRHEVAEKIRESGASICFVGLGCPRQEVFCSAMRDLVGIPLLAIGAAFNVNAGFSKLAPRWMHRAGLGWLYRLKSEPRRLWRRYILLNPAYLTLLALQASGSWEPKPVIVQDRGADVDLIPG